MGRKRQAAQRKSKSKAKSKASHIAPEQRGHDGGPEQQASVGSLAVAQSSTPVPSSAAHAAMDSQASSSADTTRGPSPAPSYHSHDDDAVADVEPAPAPTPSSPRTKIAIVGSGLTGLSAAYFLAQSASASETPSDSSIPPAAPPRKPIEIHLFERAPKIGLDSNSITIGGGGDGDDAEDSTRIDVPMRSLNAGYYPNVMQLYKHLGIPLRKSDFTYGFAELAQCAQEGKRSPSRAPNPLLLYEGSSGLRGFGMPSHLRVVPTSIPSAVLQQPLYTSLREACAWTLDITSYLQNILIFALGYLHLLLVSLWYYYTGSTRNPSHRINDLTLQTYYQAYMWHGGISWIASINDAFLHRVLVPLFSAMMTVQATSVLEAPISDIFDYVALTFGKSHYTVGTGVREVEEKISRPLYGRCDDGGRAHVDAPGHRVHVDCPVSCISLDAATRKAKITCNDSKYADFDHVILATQANQSAGFLASYMKSLSDVADAGADADRTRLAQMYSRLSAFKYEDSQVVNHTDRSVLPANELDWRDLNLVSPRGGVGGDAVKGAAPATTTTLEHNTHTMASHILVRTSQAGATASLVLQTTNPLASLYPRQSTILSVSNFERAVCTLQGKRAQRGLFDWTTTRGRRGKGRALELGQLQGRSSGGGGDGEEHSEQADTTTAADAPLPGIWVCGSWSPGIPLLEGCVVSSKLVVRALLAGENVSGDAQMLDVL